MPLSVCCTPVAVPTPKTVSESGSQAVSSTAPSVAKDIATVVLICPPRERSSGRRDDATLVDTHLLPDAVGGMRRFVEGAEGSVLHAHAHLVIHAPVHILLDFVSRVSPGAGPDDGRRRSPAAAADPVAEEAAHDGASNRHPAAAPASR